MPDRVAQGLARDLSELVGRRRRKRHLAGGAGQLHADPLADRELRRQPLEHGPEIGAIPTRGAEHRQVATDLAIATGNRLVELLELVRNARGVTLEEELARLDPQIQTRERLDETVVQITRDAGSFLEHGHLLGLALEA